MNEASLQLAHVFMLPANTAAIYDEVNQWQLPRDKCRRTHVPSVIKNTVNVIL